MSVSITCINHCILKKEISQQIYKHKKYPKGNTLFFKGNLCDVYVFVSLSLVIAHRRFDKEWGNKRMTEGKNTKNNKKK